MISRSSKILMFSFLAFTMLCLIGVVIYDYNMGGFKDNTGVFFGIIGLAAAVIGFSIFQVVRAIRRKE